MRTWSTIWFVLLAVVVLTAVSALADTPDDVVLFDPSNGEWHIRSPDASLTTFGFGESGDVPLWGDWDCDGFDSAAVFRPSTGLLILRGASGAGSDEMVFDVRVAGGVPLGGDWNGDGCDTVSMYVVDRFLVINEMGGSVEEEFFFGVPGDVPVAGDFNGDGVSSVGVFRSRTGRVYLGNSLDTGGADFDFEFGVLGDYVTVGDWDGSGVETLARFEPGEGLLHLSSENKTEAAMRVVSFGEEHWVPIGSRLVGPLPATRGRLLLLLIVASVVLAAWSLIGQSKAGSRSGESIVDRSDAP